MTWSRKRKATSSAAKVEESLANNFQECTVQLPELLSTKLGSDQPDDKMQACALLSSLSVPLENILGKSDVLPKLLGCLTGTDTVVAAEAASVLRSWTSRGGASSRLLYAHCVLPKILLLLPGCISTLERIPEKTKEEIQIFENYMVSILLAIWSFIEEIPAAIGQVNDSCILALSCLALERSSLLSEESTVVVLQLLLCANEDNQDKLYAKFLAEKVRLESLLQRKLRAGHLNSHSEVLAFGLQSIISSDFTFDKISVLFAALSQDGNSTEMTRDLLEILTNFIPEIDFSTPQDQMADIIISKMLLDDKEEEKEVASEILQRGQGCLVNLVLTQPAALTVSTKQKVWLWALRTSLPANVALPSTCELLKSSLLASLGDYDLEYSMEDISLIQQTCDSNISNDSIIGSLVSIPAIICKETDSAWLIRMVRTLFDKCRPLKTILAVAEILEELAEGDHIDDSMKEFLLTKKVSVINACKEEFMDESFKSEELDYITSVLDSILIN